LIIKIASAEERESCGASGTELVENIRITVKR
jgi:hypothetical protein